MPAFAPSSTTAFGHLVMEEGGISFQSFPNQSVCSTFTLWDSILSNFCCSTNEVGNSETFLNEIDPDLVTVWWKEMDTLFWLWLKVSLRQECHTTSPFTEIFLGLPKNSWFHWFKQMNTCSELSKIGCKYCTFLPLLQSEKLQILDKIWNISKIKTKTDLSACVQMLNWAGCAVGWNWGWLETWLVSIESHWTCNI